MPPPKPPRLEVEEDGAGASFNFSDHVVRLTLQPRRKLQPWSDQEEPCGSAKDCERKNSRSSLLIVRHVREVQLTDCRLAAQWWHGAAERPERQPTASAIAAGYGRASSASGNPLPRRRRCLRWR